jgi:ComF family protein
VYAGALRAAVLDLKRHPRIGEKAIELMHEWLRCAPLDRATRVVPVPLHKSRERERGFNQAAIIAEKLARRAAVPFDDASLVRVKYAETHRAGMDAEARRESVADSFVVARPRLIAGESVLLVDDVWTTGATAAACAAPLLEAGAREVFALTLARAELHTA